MQEIKLNKELIPRVFNGSKRATTRKGVKKYHLGEVWFTSGNGDKIGPYKIDKLEIVEWDDLSSELARIEGYQNVEELKDALIEIYGGENIFQSDEFTVVYFYPI